MANFIARRHNCPSQNVIDECKLGRLVSEKLAHLFIRGFKYEVQHGLKIHETPDAGF